MKKVIIGLGFVVVLLVGGAVFFISNLDGIVKTAIETYGSEAVGSQVSVGSVEINLTDGTAAIYDFSVANPEGFSDQVMMRFSEVSVAIDIATIRDPLIVVDSIVAREPYVLYESANGTTNVDAVSARFAGDEEETVAENSDDETDIELSIASILIENIEAQMAGAGVPDLSINLGDINLQNLQGTPDEIASQIMGPVTRQISVNAAGALLEATATMITDGLESAVDGLNGVGDALEEGLGNLFGN
ncbi:MAG: hypothetical protein P8J61_09305 [Gammaproteobacteria bacterium]|jgi:hypothetical protein|nr:hypothetical protein [Gammaproteobacteria bacterium]